MNSGQGSSNISELKKDNLDDICDRRPDNEPITHGESAGFAKEENVKLEKEKWWNFYNENLIWNAENMSVQKIGNYEAFNVWQLSGRIQLSLQIRLPFKSKHLTAKHP